MSRENVEVVEAAYREWLGGDVEAALARFSPEVEVIQPAEQVDGRTYRGHDGVLQAMASWIGQWDDYRFEVRRVVDADPHVVVTGYQRGRGKGSGVEVGTEFASVHTMEDGKVTRWQMFFSEWEALEAAGVRE